MRTSSGGTVWVNASSVKPDGTGVFTEDEVRKRFMSGAQRAHSVSTTHDEAIVKAKTRSEEGRNAPPAAILFGDVLNE